MRSVAMLALALLPAWAAASRADPVSDFYRNTNLRLIVAADSGESYDAAARLVARHLGQHIPGNPRVVVENMGGASGRIAANYLSAVAPTDGSAIAELLQTTILGQATGDPGVRYDAARFGWLGSPLTPIDVIAVRRDAGVASIDDARKREVTIGSTSATAQNYIYPALANRMLGTKFRIVTGYHGGNAINLAMERGEVQGRAAFPWNQLKATKPEWLARDEVVLLAQTGLKRHPELQQVPTLLDLATTPEARGIFELMSLTTEVGRPFTAPPDVPEDRLKALRQAFADMMRDPDFIADAGTMKEEIAGRSGTDLAALAHRILSASPETIARFKATLAGLGKP